MWFVSRVGYKGDRKSHTKNTERFYLHVAESKDEAKRQLIQFATEQEIKESGLIRPLPVAATINGLPNKLYRVSAEVVEKPILQGMPVEYKRKSHILSAPDADDAIRRISKYVNSVVPIRKASASEITSVAKLTQPDIKAAVFGK